MKMESADLKWEIDSILRPDRDEDGSRPWAAPHPRLSSEHGLDISYFRGPFDLKGNRAFERLLNDESDSLHETLQGASVPLSLFSAAFQLFGDSLIEYHRRDRRWDEYRFYPPILMTVWAAFEAWVRISSEVLVAVAPKLPRAVADALLERRSFVDDAGNVKSKRESKPVLRRYQLLLKYGCNLEYTLGSAIGQAGERMSKIRNSLVHYEVPAAPSLTALEVWNHMEAVILLFIEPSTKLRRTLFGPQFDLYSMLAGLQPLISEFEERPFHKGWPKDATIFDCPFDAVDENKYPARWSTVNAKQTRRQE